MEKALEINGHPMTYVELGGPSARSLVLLNGWAQDHRLFKNVAPDLARDFHVLSPDWRGHDRGHTVHDDFGSSDLAYDLLIFLEARRADAKLAFSQRFEPRVRRSTSVKMGFGFLMPLAQPGSMRRQLRYCEGPATARVRVKEPRCFESS
jgi:hypothetical protein